MTITRRTLCASGATLALAGVAGCFDLGGSSDANDWAWSGSLPVDTVTQHHDPSCGCCSEYVDYLETNGIDVRVEATDDLDAVKRDLGVPADAESCHTLEFGDYLVEGHVPLEAVEELFENEPDVDGLTAPGMPQHSPGMGPPGDEPLQIYAFDESAVSEFTTV
ncbi:DUF411 domain-containing protein [Natronorubrum texcoconense]|uniref:Uncharacterized conserved protein n=1 Tax=Natronorubrum texcoconense TaxID=1095776 RepID=A0A1G8UCB8_9EURY|nr:DUF411 domain-containing protein [Natronorubrum texcoconense]SDJ51419.1 Uncharacterized conserved protein [Natronorubrum texcoconense]